MPVDVAATILGLDALGARVEKATEQIVKDTLHLLQLAAAAKAPKGVPGNSTNPSGDLARSIDVEGPRGGSGVYSGQVGPTVIYGRQRELGGPIYPQVASMLAFVKFGELIITSRVYQAPEPYMKPAYEESRAAVRTLVISDLSAAIEGG